MVIHTSRGCTGNTGTVHTGNECPNCDQYLGYSVAAIETLLRFLRDSLNCRFLKSTFILKHVSCFFSNEPFFPHLIKEPSFLGHPVYTYTCVKPAANNKKTAEGASCLRATAFNLYIVKCAKVVV